MGGRGQGRMGGRRGNKRRHGWREGGREGGREGESNVRERGSDDARQAESASGGREG